MRYDVIVLGAGAAGLMCAAEAGKRGKRVALLEHSAEPGRKILISGGGRCNFTNIETSPDRFLSSNPHFAKSALARYTPEDFLGLIRKHRIPYHEKKLGQLFCDRSAKDIVAMLRAECVAGNVHLATNCQINAVRRADGFVLETSAGEYSASALVVATGGLSIPKIGATPLGYRIAKQFGLRIEPTRPALVPLTFDSTERTRWCDLSGVAAEVNAMAGEGQFREKLLITHRGLSGPAILQVSSYWQPGGTVAIDLLPDVSDPLPTEESEYKRLLRTQLPRRLADRWLEQNEANDPHCWTVHPAGTEGYEKAEVTAGGVDTNELSSKTMEARKVPGLFFVGEVVDVTGHLGGYNFQWAWASGWAAAQALN